MRSKFNIVKRHIIILTVICCFIILCQILDITCPIKYVTKVPCPTCGVTRAMLALLKADFGGYLSYHPLALPLTLSVIAMVHVKHFKHKYPVFILTAITLALNLIFYTARISAIF